MGIFAAEGKCNSGKLCTFCHEDGHASRQTNRLNFKRRRARKKREAWRSRTPSRENLVDAADTVIVAEQMKELPIFRAIQVLNEASLSPSCCECIVAFRAGLSPT